MAKLVLCVVIICTTVVSVAANETLVGPQRPFKAEVILDKVPPTELISGKICERPTENVSLFLNCRSASPTGNFPNEHAICECALCPLTLSLHCGSDLRWHSSSPSVCDTTDPEYHCGICKLETLPKEVLCLKSLTMKYGYYREVISCTCRSNCRTTTLECLSSGEWRYVNQTDLCAASSFKQDDPDPNLDISFRTGAYTNMCGNGYKLRGPGVVRCVEGLLSSYDKPACVKPTNDGKNTVTSINEETNTDESENLSTSIIISIFIVALLCMLIIGIILWYKKTGRILCFKGVNSYHAGSEMQNYSSPECGRQESVAGSAQAQQAASEPDYLETMEENHYDELGPVEENKNHVSRATKEEEAKYENYGESPLYDDVGPNSPRFPENEEPLYDDVGPNSPPISQNEEPIYDDVGPNSPHFNENEEPLYDDVGPYLPPIPKK